MPTISVVPWPPNFQLSIFSFTWPQAYKHGYKLDLFLTCQCHTSLWQQPLQINTKICHWKAHPPLTLSDALPPPSSSSDTRMYPICFSYFLLNNFIWSHFTPLEKSQSGLCWRLGLHLVALFGRCQTRKKVTGDRSLGVWCPWPIPASPLPGRELSCFSLPHALCYVLSIAGSQPWEQLTSNLCSYTSAFSYLFLTLAHHSHQQTSWNITHFLSF